jgi:Zn-finger nucleic acid-binding protein
MQPCPFCQTPMQSAYSRGLVRDECEGCGAAWYEAEALARVVGGPTLEAVFAQAKGKPGRCRGCAASLQYVPGCPSCGQRACTCPTCGNAPLPAVELRDLTVEVCGKCQGVALDAQEAARILEAAAPRPAPKQEEEPPLQAADFEPEYEPPARSTVDLLPKVRLGDVPMCTTCGRKLNPRYGFVLEERLYCGSCAPEGAAPYTDELTKARPSETYGRRARHLNNGAAESAVVWLLSKLFK